MRQQSRIMDRFHLDCGPPTNYRFNHAASFNYLSPSGISSGFSISFRSDTSSGPPSQQIFLSQASHCVTRDNSFQGPKSPNGISFVNLNFTDSPGIPWGQPVGPRPKQSSFAIVSNLRGLDCYAVTLEVTMNCRLYKIADTTHFLSLHAAKAKISAAVY